MNIAYLIGSTVSGKANGVVSQASTWANGLRTLGHRVEMINPWGHYDWRSFDIIHVFGYGAWLDVVSAIAERTTGKIVISPIIDSNRPYFFQKMASYCGLQFLHMTSPLHSLRNVGKHLSKYYVRSMYEGEYLIKFLGVSSKKINKVPLTCRFADVAFDTAPPRGKFCLHVSILSSKNKNVKRLICAAIKYKFKLVLAGNPGTEQFKNELNEIIRNNKNIEYLGFVSEEKLIELYSTARVFALPSLFEGVGLVALEAAALGADIVLTNRGAPKEYYDGKAFLVDPNNMDEIGSKIIEVISGKTKQPCLREFIYNNFKNEQLVKVLEKSYLDLSTSSTP